MDNFLQQLINGLTLGSIYGLIAIGYTMVYGIIGMINFAHGDVFMLSAFIALLIFLVLSQVVGVASLPVAFVIVLIGGMVLTSVWNWTIERIAYRPLRGSFRLAPLISAIGMSTFLSNFVQVVQGPRNKPVPPMFTNIINVGGASHQIVLQYRQIVIMVVTAILLVGFWWLVQKTALGRAQRACEQDSKMAALMGVDVDRTISITFVIGASLAAVAGTLYMMYYGVVNFSDAPVNGLPRGRARSGIRPAPSSAQPEIRPVLPHQVRHHPDQQNPYDEAQRSLHSSKSAQSAPVFSSRFPFWAKLCLREVKKRAPRPISTQSVHISARLPLQPFPGLGILESN